MSTDPGGFEDPRLGTTGLDFPFGNCWVIFKVFLHFIRFEQQTSCRTGEMWTYKMEIQVTVQAGVGGLTS